MPDRDVRGIRLSIDTSAATAAAFGLITVGGVLLLSMIAIFLVWSPASELAIVHVVALAMMASGAWIAINAYERAVWVNGTTIIHRTIRGDRHYDLATASVQALHGPILMIYSPGLPALHLELFNTPRWRGEQPVPLPPHDLFALANALEAGAHQPHVAAMVDDLRRRAAGPFGGL